MVLGVIGIAAGGVAIPLAASGVAASVASIAQGAGAQQQGKAASKPAKPPDPDDPRLKKFTLIAHCSEDSPLKDQVEGKQVVLRDRKLYLDDQDPSQRKFEDGHGFSGFYVDYPWNDKPRGLVSTIRPDPPELNWIYVNKDTLLVEHGGKTQSLPHLVGPWDWTENKERLLFEGWEGFAVIEDTEGCWLLCYDREQDHLASVRGEKRVLKCTLERIVSSPPVK
ncbi:hypothetical protein EDD18DRAFT_1283271 [Armillaria luteobubalina]|uniref:Uncharacterized protein n=1 Tax=Armillaria luteobubalina TaxID=153913 RepID=A0AA39Q9B1_9AGAR|nr:hypothetical protein EDD18DRAFT_1283271 [Armillaria luteobubalina]